MNIQMKTTRRAGTLRNSKFKSQDDDVMRTDVVMMRAADDKMRADDDMTIAHDNLKTACHYLPQFI